MTRLTDWWRALPPARADAIVVGLVLAEVQLEAWLDTGILDSHRLSTSVAALVFVVPLALRRTTPAVAVVACGVVAMAQASLGGALMQDMTGTLLPPVLLAYSIGRRTPRRQGLWGLLAGEVLLCGAIVLSTRPIGTGSQSSLMPDVAGECVLATGAWMLEERSRAISRLGDLADQVVRDQAKRQESAVGDERRRIALELQDVVAQQIGALGIQAAGAAGLARRDPERAAAALRAIETGGQQALDDLRRAVHLLRGAPHAEAGRG